MTTDDAVHLLLAAIAHHGFAKTVDGLLSLADSLLDKAGQRPIGITETAANLVQMAVKKHQDIVEVIAEAGGDTADTDFGVKLIAMQHQQGFAAQGLMSVLFADNDIGELQLVVV